MSRKDQIVIFKPVGVDASIEVQVRDETVWLNQSEIGTLFERDQSVISRYVNKVFKEGELDKKSNRQKMHK